MYTGVVMLHTGVYMYACRKSAITVKQKGKQARFHFMAKGT